MEISTELIDDLMLDLSLASALPMASEGRNKIRVVASVNAIASISKDLAPRELRALEYAIGPLLVLMTADIDEPLAVKAAFAISSLMASRVCMKRLLESGGLVIIGKIFDNFLSVDRNLDLKVTSISRSILDHLSAVYKAVGLYFPWEIVRVGAIRHCVTLLRRGGLTLQTNVAGTLAALSEDLDICKQMFANGAVKPILNISDADITNEPCMLAGLGCITQFARIYDIGIKMARQGVIRVLEKGLHREEGYVPHVIREKAVYAMAWLSKMAPIKHLISTPTMLSGLVKQFSIGTIGGKYQVVSVLLHLHGSYPKERSVILMRECRDDFLSLLYTDESQWQHRNLIVQAFCVLYRENEDKLHFVKNGLLSRIFDIIRSKPEDLQEANLVLLLSLCSHPDIPDMILNEGGAGLVATILGVVSIPVIRDLAIVLLKSLALYQWEVVEEALDNNIPPERSDLKQLESPNCTLFGSEYGQFIEEYLQSIIGNRREQKYLLTQFMGEGVDAPEISAELLASYQKAFMELDQQCRGFLEVDALKVIMVLLGEQLDDEELQDIFNEYDTNLTGRMDFVAFIALMKGWKAKFGFGMMGTFNQATKRGVVGRARRVFGDWWNRDKNDREAVLKIKMKNEIERRKTTKEMEKFMISETLKAQRAEEMVTRKVKALYR